MQPVPQTSACDAPGNFVPRGRSPLKFFLLVFALSVPFAWLGGATALQLHPGIPVSALGFVCPATAAAILTRREKGRAGAWALLRRSFDFEPTKAKGWYAPVVLFVPAVAASTYVLMRSTEATLPAPLFGVVATPVMLLVFFVAALGEELGWSGYAIDPLQE